MSAWPSYALIYADGYGVAQDSDVSRTPWDDGLIRQERRYSAALTVRRITADLADDDDLVRFRVWAEENAHQWFAWADPEDGVAREVRVRGGVGGIEYQAVVTADLRRRWELTCELEGYAGQVIQTGE